ncbi:MAG: hypothetical protein Q7R99_03055 [bacterium]|nr:hypothetical protein [bacterium]
MRKGIFTLCVLFLFFVLVLTTSNSFAGNGPDGFPASVEIMIVGSWYKVSVWTNITDTYASIVVDPKEWDLRGVRIEDMFKEGTVATGPWSIFYDGIGRECTGFSVELPTKRSILIFLVRPKKSGFFKIHYEFGSGKNGKTINDWTNRVVDSTPPPPPPLPPGFTPGVGAPPATPLLVTPKVFIEIWPDGPPAHESTDKIVTQWGYIRNK